MSIFRDKDGNPRRMGCLGKTVVGIGLYLLVCGLVGYWMGQKEEVKLLTNSVYKLEMKGTVVEQGEEENPFADILSELPGSKQENVIGLDDLLSNIRLAKEDSRIQGIYLKGGELNMGYATAKALRDALLDFKTSGKWIVAYADVYQQNNYYVCCVADKVYLNAVGTVDWKGLTTQKLYFARLLDKLGIEMQILKVGTFKSAVEPYYRTSMSEADRQQTEKFLKGMWSEMTNGVSVSRGIGVNTLNRYADSYLALAEKKEYVRLGMVDSLCYVQDMDSVLKHRMGCENYHLVSTSSMNRVKRAESEATDAVAIIYADGAIYDDGNEGIVTGKMLKTFKKVGKNSDVKAVVLRVNSPGGSANASEQIWHGVQLLRQQGLPVVVSMGDYAASGGYYISCGADYIYAEPNTLTGSIGIFGTVPSLAKLRDKIGLDIDGVSTNAHSEMEVNMIYRGMNSAETAMMQNLIDQGYDLFTNRCAMGRHMSQADIKAIAEGRVWLGSDALNLGLVDELGGIEAAVQKAAELAGLGENYTRVAYPERRDMLSDLLESFERSTPEEKLIARIREFASQPRIMAQMEEMIIK